MVRAYDCAPACKPTPTPCRPHAPKPCGAVPCINGGYIVERVLDTRSEQVGFDGALALSGLPGHLCPPLCLRAVEVVCIEPCCASTVYTRQTLARVTLCCWVEDARGCRAQGTAQIEVQLEGLACAQACGVNVRRGGQAQLHSACFCPPCSFQVCLTLCVSTVVSQCELLAQRPCGVPACPSLPLYPPPPKPQRPGGCWIPWGR